MNNSKNNKTSYKGVVVLKKSRDKPYQARLTVNGRAFYGQRRPTALEAARDYNELFLTLVPDMINKLDGEVKQCD